MTEKRFTTNGYYIYDHFKGDKWLVNEVEVEYIVTQMNNIDTKARERSKALSKLQKENEQLKKDVERHRRNFRAMEDVKCELAEENNELKEAMKRMMIEMIGGNP